MPTDDDLLARLDRLEGAIASLADRVAALEGLSLGATEGLPLAPKGRDAGGREGVVSPAPPDQGVPRAPSPGSGSPEGLPSPVLPPEGGGKPVDWERLIAGRWALWVGALAIFLAVAFFLAYAWQFLAPTARVAGGFALGAALLGAARYLRPRAEPWFAEGLAGAGLGLFYLNAWSAYQTHHLIGTQPAFAALLAITAVGAFLALRFDAPSLIALATAGGFLAPLVIGGAGGRDLGVPVYALVLDAGLLAISLFRRWPGLGWACLAGTLGLWISADAAATPWPAFAVLTATFALFAGTAVGYSLRRGERTAPHDVLLLLAAAFMYAPAGYSLIDAPLGAWKPAFPLGLAAAFAGVGLAARRLVPANQPFRMGADALAIFFVTLAVPTWLAQDRLAIAWTVEAALLAAMGLRYDDALFRRLARVVAVVALATTAWWGLDGPPAGAWPLVNPAALPLAVAALASLGVLVYARTVGREARGAVVALVAATAAWLVGDAESIARLAEVVPDKAAARLGAAGIGLAAGLYFLLGRWAGAGLRVAALALWGLAALGLVFEDFTGAAAAGADWRPLGTAGVLAGGLAIAFGARGLAAGPREAKLTGLLGLALVLVGVWGASVEAQGLVRAIGQEGWERQASLAISLVWIASAVACLVAGIRAGSRPFRLLGLGLLGASVVKVFAFDLAFLDTPYRIAAFAGLGGALIGISWLYGRYGTDPRPEGPSAVPAGGEEADQSDSPR